MQPGASADIALDAAFNATGYVFDDEIAFGAARHPVGQGHMALFGAGGRLAVSARATRTGGRFLLLAGSATAEPVARHGPFVMNSREELLAAVDDYHAGRMGVIERE